MPYTALGTPQTAWARHLDNIRRERKWSATALFEDCHEALGLGPKSLTSFKRVLVDKEMPAEWAAALTKRYGAPSPEAVTPRKPVDVRIEERRLELLELQVAAANRAADAAERQAAAMEWHVALLERQTVATEALAAAQLPAELLRSPELDRQVELLRAWGQASRARTMSPATQGDPLPTAGR